MVERLRAAEESIWVRSRDEHRSATMAEILEIAQYEASIAQLEAYERWWDQHTHTDPDAPALLAGLRERGIAVGVLSNTMWDRSRHEQIFARDGVLHLIDGAVYTSEIPWTKPHPLAFRAALDAVGVADPARAVFVGDRLFDDIHGAASAGMRTILLPHSDIPEWQVGATTGDPDAVVQRLGDVLSVVDGWN